MKLQIAEIPQLLLQRRASAILGMVILAMLWGAVAFTYRDNVNQTYQEVERRNQNYAMVFEENVLRSIGEIDKALLYMRRTVEATKDSKDYQTIVMTTDVLSEIIIQVAIIDAEGFSRGSNALPAPKTLINISDREHFRVHLDSGEDKLFISKPLIGRASGRWSVQFTRRFSNMDGSFAGVVVASMDPSHFTTFYDKIDLGATTSVAMVGADGVVRSSGGAAVTQMKLGDDIRKSSLYQGVRSEASAVFNDAGAGPEESLIVASRKVRGHPLWVMVSTKSNDIFVSARESLQISILVAILLTGFTLWALELILRSEARAKQKAEQLTLTLKHISQGIMLVTKDHEIPVINERCVELLKLPKTSENEAPRFADVLRHQAESGAIPPSIDLLRQAEPGVTSGEPSISDYRRPDGVFIEVRQSLLPEGGVVQTFTDITVRREAEASIARLASEDPLTQLANRRVFRAKLEELIRSRRNAATTDEFAVLFLDMDRFKLVNDTLGHRVGDGLLIEIAKRLRSVIREDDVLARLGGDEFAILIPRLRTRHEVEMLAQRIVDSTALPFEVGHHRISSNMSVGIAIGPHDGKTEDELLVAADLALYAVKSEGRGTYRFYQKSMNDEVTARRQIELDLHDAIENGGLELFYQPIIDVASNSVVAFEALTRWRHPVRGMIPPSTFIAIAEDTGLIVPLGKWALGEACRMAANWPEHIRVAVNVSPIQLSQADLPQTLADVLAETGIDPSRLALEFTERMFMEDSERTLATLHDLKALGVRISLDDFGTGYSSLSYLRSFPFDTLKIDRSFVADLATDPGSHVIVQAVLLIARGLGMRIIAEGIETPEQFQILRGLGCEKVQGYLLSRPVPAERTPGLIEKFSVGKAKMAAA